MAIRDTVEGLDLLVMQQRGEMRGNWAGSTPYLTDPAAWSLKVQQSVTDPEVSQGFDMTQYTFYNV